MLHVSHQIWFGFHIITVSNLQCFQSNGNTASDKNWHWSTIKECNLLKHLFGFGIKPSPIFCIVVSTLLSYTKQRSFKLHGILGIPVCLSFTCISPSPFSLSYITNHKVCIFLLPSTSFYFIVSFFFLSFSFGPSFLIPIQVKVH